MFSLSPRRTEEEVCNTNNSNGSNPTGFEQMDHTLRVLDYTQRNKSNYYPIHQTLSMHIPSTLPGYEVHNQNWDVVLKSTCTNLPRTCITTDHLCYSTPPIFPPHGHPPAVRVRVSNSCKSGEHALLVSSWDDEAQARGGKRSLPASMTVSCCRTAKNFDTKQAHRRLRVEWVTPVFHSSMYTCI